MDAEAFNHCAAASSFGFGSLEIRLNADSHNTPASGLRLLLTIKYL
jgi:hypothetical protein